MLKKQFWMMMPGSFGKDIMSDLGTILTAAAFAIPEIAVQRNAFNKVMGSVKALFAGELCQGNHLDSGFAAALKESPGADLGAFKAEKERFFNEGSFAAGLFHNYESVKEQILHANDRKKQDFLKDKALRSAVRLVLCAHEFKAKEEDWVYEAAFARTLEEIVTGRLIITRKAICTALEETVEKNEQEYRSRVHDTGYTMMSRPPSPSPKEA